MAIADNLVCQIYPVAGETAVKNIVSGSLFAGTGTPTLVDEGAEKAWTLTTTTALDLAVATKIIDGNSPGSGATIAIRFKLNSATTADFMPIFGIKASAGQLADGLVFTRNGSTAYRGRCAATIPAGVSSKANGIIHTLVYKVEVSQPALDVGKIWFNTVGRVGTTADVTSTGANLGTPTFNTMSLACSGGAVITILDAAYWSVEKTDAECAAIADNYRAVMPAPSGGTAPTGTVTIGTITPNSTGASVPFTYSASDQTGFEYRINGGTAVAGTTSPQVLTGLTSSTAYTIEIRAINASGAGAWSTQANFTTSAAGSPPAGTFTVGTITTTQTTASVTYTYSAADFDSIEYRIDGGTPVTASASPQALSGLTSATTYGIEFRAVNTFGNGAWSTSAAFTTASVAVGTITIPDVVNNTDTPWASAAVDVATVMPVGLGSVVVNKTGLSVTVGASLIITDAAIVTGTEYIIILKIGTAYGWYRAVAT